MLKLFSVTLLASLAGCAVDASDPAHRDPAADPAPSAPRFHLLLTDAPGDFQEVWVNIAKVEIEGPAGWQQLTDTPQRFDLLTLQNDVTAALGETTLEPGMYGQLRLIVDTASVVVDDVESPLKIASGAETGIKIPLAHEIEANMEYTLTLDYDAHKSVKHTGTGYLMTPVIHVKDFVATPVEPPQDPPESPIE